MVGRPPAASDLEILVAVSESLDHSGDPVVTTREVADRLPIKREGVSRRLTDLADRRLLSSKEIGASYAWWLPDPVSEVLSVLADSQYHGSDGPSSRSFESRLQGVFDAGREQFGLEIGVVARVDPDTNEFVVEYVTDDGGPLTPGTRLPLSETYCTEPLASGGPASVSDPAVEGLEDRIVYDELGLQAYLGTAIDPDDRETSRTFFFSSGEKRSEPFDEQDHELHDLLGAYLERQFDQRAATPG